MHNSNVWELPFGEPAVLELQAEYGSIALLPVEAGQRPRVELSRGSADDVEVCVDKLEETVRVSLEPRPSFKWFGSWDCRAVAYVPRDLRAAVQTNAGSVSVRNLDGCELGIKANAGKIDLVDVYGLFHLGADAGSITGRRLGGSFDVETHAGAVRLEILDLQPGEHRIQAAMGAIRIELARGMDVAIETRTSLGSVRNSYPVRPDAVRRLVLSTEMGNVRVDEASIMRPTPRSGLSAERTVPREDPELERILKMVESGELSAADADELLRAMGRV